jgi:Uma2 family endonuclease
MDTLLENITRSYKLVRYFDIIQKILKDELNKRDYFYNVVTESQKAEFINGDIIVHSPVKIEHEFTSNSLNVLLRSYVLKNSLSYVGHEKMLISLSRNDYEPDICFFGNEKSKEFKPGQMKFPPPDFIVEILSPSAEERDRTIKYEDYAFHGIKEYWMVDPEKKIVEKYLLDGDKYKLMIKSDSGVIASDVIGGFEIPIAAIFDEKENINTLQNILNIKI